MKFFNLFFILFFYTNLNALSLSLISSIEISNKEICSGKTRVLEYQITDINIVDQTEETYLSINSNNFGQFFYAALQTLPKNISTADLYIRQSPLPSRKAALQFLFKKNKNFLISGLSEKTCLEQPLLKRMGLDFKISSKMNTSQNRFIYYIGEFIIKEQSHLLLIIIDLNKKLVFTHSQFFSSQNT